MRRKITIQELIHFLKSKDCKRSHQQYIAEELLKQPSHPITSTESNLSTHLFDTIEIIDEPQTGSGNSI